MKLFSPINSTYVSSPFNSFPIALPALFPATRTVSGQEDIYSPDDPRCESQVPNTRNRDLPFDFVVIPASRQDVFDKQIFSPHFKNLSLTNKATKPSNSQQARNYGFFVMKGPVAGSGVTVGRALIVSITFLPKATSGVQSVLETTSSSVVAPISMTPSTPIVMA